MDHLRALRVLGLAQGAGPGEIRTAWRDLAQVWHPDRFAHDERLRAKAGENLKRINEAYEALRDYDPSQTPRVSARIRQSVSVILGLDELGEAPPAPAGSAAAAPGPGVPAPSGPVPRRRSVRILGLGVPRGTGAVEAPVQRARWGVVAGVVALAAAMIAVAILLLAR